MSIIAFKHTHTLLVSLFIISYLIKTYLLLSNSSSLEKYRNATMKYEMIIAALFLATGFYMIFQIGFANIHWWFHLKLTLIVIAIPLGIIGFKKSNKPLAVLSTLLFLYVFLMAFTKKPGLFF